MLFVFKIKVIVLHNFKYMGSLCATKYIRTSISTAVITRITWWENYFTLPSGFHGCSFKLLRDLSGESRKGSTLHKPNHWVIPCTTSKQTLLYRWKWAKVSKGECEAAAAAAGLAGLGSARKGDFQTQFILNKMLNNLCYNLQQLLL